MNPRHFVFAVVQDDLRADRGAFVVTREFETLRKSAFNQIPWHDDSPLSSANVQAGGRVVKGALVAHRAGYLFCGWEFPILVMSTAEAREMNRLFGVAVYVVKLLLS